ncbi:YecR family lipoprotein [Xanthomonas phaseoli]|uniref:YecR family lipoprotein n=1 Tax=Xanthomonas phaseoli TaxID=1985254 RepID=UPI0009B68C21|nr:YecR family lipoprotein [Xanthomonas phaseoli]MBO9722466.1 hypothetical protein [Xanthomonas phaseoli pv. manihotis]
MSGKMVALVLSTAIGLAGCATQKEMLVTGASRSDGTITLAYESNEFQRVSVDGEKALDMATQRCKAWGYDGAESFGSQETECLSRRGFGNCGSRRVSVVYQCTGSPVQR